MQISCTCTGKLDFIFRIGVVAGKNAIYLANSMDASLILLYNLILVIFLLFANAY